MYFPFRHPVCFAPDGAAAGAPAGEPAAGQIETQQAEQTEQQTAAPEAAPLDAPAEQEQPAAQQEQESAKPAAPAKAEEAAPDAEAQLTAMTALAMQAELRSAAAISGVPEARIPYVLRMADTQGVDLTAADAREKIAAAVSQVLSDVPELRGAGSGTGSVGNFARKTDAPDELDGRIVRNIMG